MPFSTQLKLTIKGKVHFTCRWCTERTKKVHVHHIVPESQGGADTEENAAPLCGSCHDLYGNNPDLRREVRLRRDHWYKMCEAGAPVRSLPSTQLVNSGQVATLRESIREAWSTAVDLENHLCCSLGTPDVYEERLKEHAQNLYVQIAFILEAAQLRELLSDFKAELADFQETKRVRFSTDESGNLYASTLGQLARYASPLLTATGHE